LAEEKDSEPNQPKRSHAVDYILGAIVFAASYMAARGVPRSKQNSDQTDTNQQIANWTAAVAEWTKKLVFWTRWIVAVGIATAVVLGIQTRTLINQLNEQVIEQRPWIKISDIEIPEVTFWKSRPDFPTGRIDARINAKFTNIGKAPADNIKIIPMIYATGSNAGPTPAEAARKVLIEKLLAYHSAKEYNQFLFPNDFFDEKELPATTDDVKIPGSLDFNAPNDLVSVHALIGVRYKVGDEVGYTIVPADAISMAADATGAIRWQLSVMRSANPTYKAVADYMVIVQKQGIEAH